MPSRPIVSILINNYNYGQFLSEAIDSALNQTYPFIEVVVVDDGSTDHSRGVIAQYQGIQYQDKVISVLKENGGQASAFNAGFAASRGEIICLLDSDDLFMPQKAAEIVEVFDRDRDTGWCFHPLQLVDASAKPLPSANPQSPAQAYDFRATIQNQGKLNFNAPATSGLSFRRSLLAQILPMPEANKVSLGDHYLKFAALGLSKGFFSNQQFAHQRVHSTNAYTLKGDNQRLKARILVLTAYWLRIKFPTLDRFTHNLLARGISTYWRSGGVEAEQRSVIQQYLNAVSLRDRFEINSRTLYRYLLPK